MSLLRIIAIYLSITLASAVSATPEIRQSQADLAADRQLLLQRWAEFCDTLKATGERIVQLDRGEPINTAEGFHYLAMLTGMAIERIQGYEASLSKDSST